MDHQLPYLALVLHLTCQGVLSRVVEAEILSSDLVCFAAKVDYAVVEVGVALEGKELSWLLVEGREVRTGDLFPVVRVVDSEVVAVVIIEEEDGHVVAEDTLSELEGVGDVEDRCKILADSDIG